MLHHNRTYIETLDADRRAASRRRPPVDATELERIVTAAATGDGAAWSALVERFAARVRAVARSYRLAAHDVEDVVQATWLRLFEHIDAVREPDALGAWLETTSRRESLRILRTHQRESPTDSTKLIDQPVAPVDDRRLVAAEHRAVLAECRGALVTALEQLPARQRALVTMLFADSAASYQTISSSLGLSVGSIGPIRGRALTRLRRNRALANAAAKLD